MTPEWGHHFAGLVDGEGCFQIRIASDLRSRACTFTIGLRADDEPLLVELRERSGGLGNLYHPDRTNFGGNPITVWEIASKADCLALIAILDHYPLRSKKLRDYEIWKQALVAYMRRDYGEMRRLRQMLREGRAYQEAPFVMSGPEWEQLELGRYR